MSSNVVVQRVVGADVVELLGVLEPIFGPDALVPIDEGGLNVGFVRRFLRSPQKAGIRNPYAARESFVLRTMLVIMVLQERMYAIFCFSVGPMSTTRFTS